jgi:hypothetical protein
MILVFKVWFVSFVPKSHKRIRTCYLQRSTTEHPSTCHCIRCLHNLLNVLAQIANKMGLKKCHTHICFLTRTIPVGLSVHAAGWPTKELRFDFLKVQEIISVPVSRPALRFTKYLYPLEGYNRQGLMLATHFSVTRLCTCTIVPPLHGV